MACTVYILQSETSGRLYIGHTNDLDRRLEEHRAGQTRATRGRGPWVLIHREEFDSRAAAMQKEKWFKRQKSREFILSYVRER